MGRRDKCTGASGGQGSLGCLECFKSIVGKQLGPTTPIVVQKWGKRTRFIVETMLGNNYTKTPIVGTDYFGRMGLRITLRQELEELGNNYLGSHQSNDGLTGTQQ
jgi:hypothetical protein